MRDFHEEHSILHELSARLAERPVLVTFNGKSFDWPLLENRFTMTRAIKTPKLAAHLDLLHPSRALWKLRLGSVRLVELERHVLDAPRLGWDRVDDVHSAMIPQHYFDYIRGGPAEPLAAVIRHNQMDLRGLAAILARIEGLLDAAERADEDVESLDLVWSFAISAQARRSRPRACGLFASARPWVAGRTSPASAARIGATCETARRSRTRGVALARTWLAIRLRLPKKFDVMRCDPCVRTARDVLRTADEESGSRDRVHLLGFSEGKAAAGGLAVALRDAKTRPNRRKTPESSRPVATSNAT